MFVFSTIVRSEPTIWPWECWTLFSIESKLVHEVYTSSSVEPALVVGITLLGCSVLSLPLPPGAMEVTDTNLSLLGNTSFVGNVARASGGKKKGHVGVS